MRALTACALLCATLTASAQPKEAPERAPVIALRAAKVMTMAGPPIADGVVVIRDRKIVAVGRWGELALPAGAKVIDGGDGWLVPGLIELHCHIAGANMGDLNDMVHQTNPELRNLDNVLPDNDRMRDGLQGGVTTALFLPGSGTNMGGFGTLVKFGPKRPEDAVLRFPGALKIAQAGNPERAFDFGRGRMGMNAMIRSTLNEGKRYHEAWLAHEAGKGPKPERSPRLENLRGLFSKRYPILVHTQGMQVLHSTLRILVGEFKLRPILSHASFDAYLNGKLAAERKVHMNPGPRQYQFDRRRRIIYGLAERWWTAGVRDMSVCTDSPVLSQGTLALQGTLGAHWGAPPKAILEGLTIGAAKALYIEDRVGSLAKGKDADVVLWSGDPLDPRSRVQFCFVNGERVYDLVRDRGRN